MTPPPLPAPPYGRAALADLTPALLHALGMPGEPDALGLPPTRAACLLVVDGLGAGLLAQHSAAAPVLTGLADGPGSGGRGLWAGFPSTTATSLTSLGTGLPPGQHGVLGYEVAVPGRDLLLNALRWDASVDPLTWQPHPTTFERAAQAGVAVSRVAVRAYERSGLTRAGLRGGRAVGADSAGELVAAVVAALAGPRPALVYAYVADLDGTGHRAGCDSPAWHYELAQVDRLVEQIVDGLPAGADLYVTADHGMVDVPPDARVDLAVDTDLAAGVRVLGGEPRARYVYTRPGAAPDVLATWRERLGDRFWVLSRAEAVAYGLFGPDVPESLAARLGDVVAAAYEPWAVVDSRREPPGLLALVGLHGSLTEAETAVPLLHAAGRR